MNSNRQSLGGVARASSLSKSERQQIASNAAQMRWKKEAVQGSIPKATHKGTLEIGDVKIPCAVLEDGRRILSTTGISEALGSRSGSLRQKLQKQKNEGLTTLPVFVAPDNLKPFISKELLEGPLKEIVYRDGRKNSLGFEATILPKVCNIWLEAREAGALLRNQEDRAQNAEVLIRALANVGIVALVDEATGFQNDRERDALHKLLSVYLVEERLAWAKKFPDEFYKQVYRLNNWAWPVGKAKTPYLGHITNDIVYERLPEGVLNKLRELNPVKEKTHRRRYKHHQFLSEDVGQPDLREHILQILPLMKVSKTWLGFKKLLDQVFPKKGTQIEMDLTD